MTEIERKALALVNEVSDGFHDVASIYDIHTAKALRSALCRAIEQHEAFRQEVSDAVESLCNTVLMSHGHRQLREMLSHRFIIAKPDPLVEAWQMAFPGNHIEDARDECAKIIAAIEKRGGKIVWGEG